MRHCRCWTLWSGYPAKLATQAAKGPTAAYRRTVTETRFSIHGARSAKLATG